MTGSVSLNLFNRDGLLSVDFDDENILKVSKLNVVL